MILPDVNVLVNAFRRDTSDHARCQQWLESVVNRESRYGMSPQVLGGVVRVATHPRVFSQSSDLDEVIRFCAVLMETPHSARAAALVHLLPPLQRSGRARQPCAGCLVRRTGHRIRLRVDHSRPRLRPVHRSSLAPPFLTGELPLTAATALLATPKRGEGGCRPAAKRAHQSVSTQRVTGRVRPATTILEKTFLQKGLIKQQGPSGP